MIFKKFFLSILIFFFSHICFSEQYQITEVFYELEKTNESDLKRKVHVNRDLIFQSEEELNFYLKDLQQRLMNTRAFDAVNLDYQNFIKKNDNEEINGTDSTEIIKLSLKISAKDTKHLLILPYPKYDSNDGALFKIKLKDVNFLGTLNTLDAGIFAGLKEDSATGDQNLTFGAEFNYSYPFSLGPFLGNWNNKYDFQYTSGVNELEFNTGTGLTFELPFNRFSLVFDVSEHANRDLDYEKYSDEQYYTTDFKFSVPVKVFDIENWGYIFWTPFSEAKYNYDKNKINIDNDDLAGPVISAGQEISTTRINWYGNFRRGLSLRVGNSIGYDFLQDEIEPKFFGEIQFFTCLKYIGLNSRVYAFVTNSNREKIGDLIRGVRDKQKYANLDFKALKTPSAVVFNLDIPVHLISTHWLNWSYAIFGEDSWISRSFSWTDKFNFELQISPFIDIALTKNEVTKRLFSAKDGWYTGGVEVLIFPEHWKGIVIRGSFGLDLGRAFIAKKYPDKIDLTWREDVKKYEIYAGIGLHY